LKYTNINGKLIPAAEATVPASSRAFRYGYGLFETMLCIDGELQLAAYHWQRLFEGMELLHYELPQHFTVEMLEKEILKTIAKNQLQKLCRIRLQVYPGSGGLFEMEDRKPQYLIECYELEPGIIKLNENGLTLGIYSNMRKSNDVIANLKSCNALIYAMAAREAKEQQWNDALVCNTAGNIIESAIANIFWVKDNQLFTPHLYEGCIAGVMRRHIMENFEVTEQPLSAKMLHNADEIFLTNAIRRIKWVKQIDNTTYHKDYIQHVYGKLFL